MLIISLLESFLTALYKYYIIFLYKCQIFFEPITRLIFFCPLGLTTSLSPHIMVGRARIRTCVAFKRWIYSPFIAVKVFFLYFIYILYHFFYKKSNRSFNCVSDRISGQRHLPIMLPFRATVSNRTSVFKLFIIHRNLPFKFRSFIVQ